MIQQIYPMAQNQSKVLSDMARKPVNKQDWNTDTQRTMNSGLDYMYDRPPEEIIYRDSSSQCGSLWQFGQSDLLQRNMGYMSCSEQSWQDGHWQRPLAPLVAAIGTIGSGHWQRPLAAAIGSGHWHQWHCQQWLGLAQFIYIRSL